MKNNALTLLSLVLCACSGGNEARIKSDSAGKVAVTADSRSLLQVAALDFGVNEVDPAKLQPYERVFSDLDKKCRDSETQLADYAQVAVKNLSKQGKPVTRLEFLSAVENSIPTEMGNDVNCAEVSAMVLTLMGKEAAQ